VFVLSISDCQKWGQLTSPNSARVRNWVRNRDKLHDSNSNDLVQIYTVPRCVKVIVRYLRGFLSGGSLVVKVDIMSKPNMS